MKNNIKKFKLKNNLPLGGKKDRIIIVDDTHTLSVKRIFWEDNPSELCVYNPLNPADKSFFIEVIPDPEPPFAIGSLVMINKNNVYGTVVKSYKFDKRIKAGTKFYFPRYTGLKVVRCNFDKVNDIVVLYDNIEYAMNSKNLDVCEKYYFINSSGTVCGAIIGKDKNADTYRSLTNNKFSDSHEANNVLNKIMFIGQ